jgi:hypothetical protein
VLVVTKADHPDIQDLLIPVYACNLMDERRGWWIVGNPNGIEALYRWLAHSDLKDGQFQK